MSALGLNLSLLTVCLKIMWLSVAREIPRMFVWGVLDVGMHMCKGVWECGNFLGVR